MIPAVSFSLFSHGLPVPSLFLNVIFNFCFNYLISWSIFPSEIHKTESNLPKQSLFGQNFHVSHHPYVGLCTGPSALFSCKRLSDGSLKSRQPAEVQHLLSHTSSLSWCPKCRQLSINTGKGHQLVHTMVAPTSGMIWDFSLCRGFRGGSFP